MNQQLLTVDQVAQRLQCGRSTVYKFIREHGLPAIKLPDATRIDPERLSAWLAARSTQRATDAQWRAFVAPKLGALARHVEHEQESEQKP